MLSLNGKVDGGDVNGFGKSYETGGIFDVATEEWLEYSDTPERPDQTWPQVAMEDEVVIDGLAHDAGNDSWRRLPEFPLKPREFPVMAWAHFIPRAQFRNTILLWRSSRRAAATASRARTSSTALRTRW